MVAVQHLGDGGEMRGEVALCPLGDAAAAPGDEDVLGQTRVGVFDFHVGELDAAFVEVLVQLGEFALWIVGWV